MDTEEMDHKQQDAGSLDETDAKLFTSKLFGGDKNESRQDVREENSEELADKLEKVEIKEEKALDVLVTDKDEYPSDNVRRGVCLILENDMFHTNLGLSKRKGSSVDRQVMADTFTRLQFEVRIYSNLSVKEINNTLEKTALEDHSNRDMLAVVVLSHGNEGILYGYDHSYPAHKIWEPFTADKSSSLAGKPKLFFIQACQGSKMDSGTEVKMARTMTDSLATYRTPLYADFLLAHSTVAGFYSWRNTVSGSWFIQALGKVMTANYMKEDLLTIMTKVSQVVARDYESNSSRPEHNNKKQIPFIYSTLVNKLFLKPKSTSHLL